MAGKSANRRQATGRGTKAQVATSSRRATWPWLVGGIAGAILAVVVVLVMAMGGSSEPSDGTLVRANGGSWTNISAGTLATKLENKDFTLLNVKTPYIGEIRGTDLYIPYNDLVARADQLPTDKGAPIVVYCRSGNESAIASQTLLDLGYTNIENLDGGMNAWAASGRSLVQLNRS